MKKKVVATEPKDNGTLFTYEDGTQEFMEGVHATLNSNANLNDEGSSEDEETLLAGLKKKI